MACARWGANRRIGRRRSPENHPRGLARMVLVIDLATAFACDDPPVSFTVRRRTHRNGWHWEAYKRLNGKLHSTYIGKTEALTLERLDQARRVLLDRSSAKTPTSGPAGRTPLGGRLVPRQSAALKHVESPVSTMRDVSRTSTRLVVPHPAPRLIARPRLIQLLSRSSRAPATLVIAPAGYGKTELLAQFAEELRSEGAYIAWVTLDENDLDHAHFWSDVVYALDGFAPGVAGSVLPLFTHAAGTIMGVSALLNLLDSIAEQVYVFLDNYDALGEGDSPLQAAIVDFVTHIPPQVHVIAASRSSPPWPLAQLRARRRLVELEVDDLRFTLPETTAFVRGRIGPTLTGSEITAIHVRADGRAAGLRAAELAWRDSDGNGARIDRSGGFRSLESDHLIGEAMARLSTETQLFLMSISILDRLCPELCAAATGSNNSTEMLESLVQGRTFIEALDDRGEWYRLNPQVRDVLGIHLKETQPERWRELALRASGWSEAQGYPQEAIEYALVADVPDRAAALVERFIDGALGLGGNGALQHWLAMLPEHVVRARPRLCVMDAWLSMRAGRVDAFKRRLREAEDAAVLVHPSRTFARSRSLSGEIAALQSSAALLVGDLDRSAERSERALAMLPADHAWRSLALLNQGTSQLLAGDPITGSRTLRGLLDTGQNRPSVVNSAESGAALALALLEQGRVREALSLCQRPAARVDKRHAIGDDAVLELAPGLAQYERYDLDGAAVHLERAITLQSSPLVVLMGYSALARVWQAQGDAAGARAILDDAFALGHESGAAASRWISRALEAAQARLWLLQGEQALASGWARRVERIMGVEHAGGHLIPLRVCDDERLVLARTYLSERRFSLALGLAAGVLEAATMAGRMSQALEALVLEAAALDALGNAHGAFHALRQALEMADPEGAVRVFLEMGEPVHRLLNQSLSAGEGAGLRMKHGHRRVQLHIVDTLWVAFSRMDGNKEVVSVSAPPRDALPATTERRSKASSWQKPLLTARQHQVLTLLAQGFSNRDLARELVVALGTASRHVHEILAKLDVTSRLQAVAQARILGLL